MFNRLTSILKSNKLIDISQATIDIHNQAFAELKILSPIINALDNEELTDADFVFYIRLKSYFAKDYQRYKGLKNSAELLRISIKAKDSFLKIEQTELSYRSIKQQEYYNFVFGLLQTNFKEENKNDLNQFNNLTTEKLPIKKYSAAEFKTEVNKKLEEIMPTVKSEEGQRALTEYTYSLENLAEEKELGLKLLYLFKKFELTDFSVIRTISQMVAYLQDKDMKNMKAMTDLVAKNMDVFHQIGKIIGLSKQQSNQETYSILLQYICLGDKHEKKYVQYTRLVEVLKEWYKFYETVTGIREEYPASKFKIPDEFKKEIPGIQTYQKYQDQLN